MARPLYKSFLLWTRTLHIYATMLALVLLIFFSFTGFVMNHTAFFSIDKNVTVTDTTLPDPLPAKYLGGGAGGGVASGGGGKTQTQAAKMDDEPNMWAPPPPPPTPPARGGTSTTLAATKPPGNPEHELQIEVYLRMNGAHGERDGFDEQDDVIRVHFIGAGRIMEYAIGKPDGKIDLHEEVRNSLALMSDLHKGTGTGAKWRLLVDGAAIFLMFASLSGLMLWIALPKRRTLGIIALVVSVVLCGGCFLWLLP